MIVAIVKDNTIEQTGELSVLFSNVSFPASGPSEEWMEEQGIVPVTYFKPYDQAAEKLTPVEPYLDNGAVFAVEVQPLTEDEIAARTESQWAKVRSERNAKLVASDWTQLVDTPLTNTEQGEWAVYRQALRDITNQEDPFNITWPEEP